MINRYIKSLLIISLLLANGSPAPISGSPHTVDYQQLESLPVSYGSIQTIGMILDSSMQEIIIIGFEANAKFKYTIWIYDLLSNSWSKSEISRATGVTGELYNEIRKLLYDSSSNKIYAIQYYNYSLIEVIPVSETQYFIDYEPIATPIRNDTIRLRGVVYDDYSNQIIYFFENVVTSPEKKIRQFVSTYHIGLATWTQVLMEQTIFPPDFEDYYLNSAINRNEIMYVHEGNRALVNSSIWIFDTKRFEWQNIVIDGFPSNIKFMSITYDSHISKYIMHGGEDVNTYKDVNEVWSFDSQTGHWELIDILPDNITSTRGTSVFNTFDNSIYICNRRKFMRIEILGTGLSTELGMSRSIGRIALSLVLVIFIVTVAYIGIRWKAKK